jgi:6-phosphogluconate dehydrogenase
LIYGRLKREYNEGDHFCIFLQYLDMAHFGLIGLGTMGENLARNAASKGIETVVYNRSTDKMTDFVAEHGSAHLTGEAELKDFVAAIETPRVIFLLVKAGRAVDSVLQSLVPLLEKGDIVIDGGNTLFSDTIRREKEMNAHGIVFWGCGVSGGETGALHGPSLMPGGDANSWARVQPMLEKIAAKDFAGNPCVTHIGPNGAGHYVKMVHNGIEYGIMQMMAEAYELMKYGHGMNNETIADMFEAMQNGPLAGYMTEITLPVLRKKDPENDDAYLLDAILDTAGQKGTGRWTVVDALERGVELNSIAGAVFARVSSSKKKTREKMNDIYKLRGVKMLENECDTQQIVAALEASIILAYSEGIELIRVASAEQDWNIDLQEVCRIWQGGCIIRSTFLTTCAEAFAGENTHLLSHPPVVELMHTRHNALSTFVLHCVESGIPAYSTGGALTSFRSFVHQRTSANFIQGLRDYFGAHTYERIDKTGVFHTQWE